MNSDLEEEIAKKLAQQLQKVIDLDILMSLTGTMAKLTFKPVTNEPLRLEYSLQFGDGIYTSTAISPEHINPVLDWCSENECGLFLSSPRHILFRNEGELAWFLLRWS